METLNDRVKSIISAKRTNANAVTAIMQNIARAENIAPVGNTYVRDILYGRIKDPGYEKTIILAKALGVSPEWLNTGKGESGMTVTDTPYPVIDEQPDIGLAEPQQLKYQAKAPTSIIIPEIDGFAGMGSMEGAVELECNNGMVTEPVKANWSFPPSWLSSVGLKPSSDGLYLIEGLGDSNAPMIHSGDKLLINTNDKTPSPPGFFALWDGLGVTVKRLEVILKSDPIRLKVSSANPNYSSTELTIDEVNIIGRVWAGVMRF